MNSLIDSHYLSLPSQGNVYLSVKFEKIDGSNKILVASLRRKIYLIEYQYATNFMEPITKEVFFAYISANSDITSIDVLNRSKYIDDFVIGIVIRKNSDSGTSAQLNLYSEYDLEPNTDLSLETIGQSCESFVLNYIPYGLHHVEISPHQIGGSYENLWLLPGNDNKIHAYRGFYSERCHAEIPIDDYFTEFCNLPSVVLSLSIIYYNDYRQSRVRSSGWEFLNPLGKKVTVLMIMPYGNKNIDGVKLEEINCTRLFGCENGFVRCAIVDCMKNRVLRSICVEYENPVSNVQVFGLKMSALTVQDQFTRCDGATLNEENPIINLLVTNTVFHSEVFMDIVNYGLSRKHCLFESAGRDACLCSVIADIDMDGHNEIILGTYGEELLLFKYVKDGTWNFVDGKSVPNPVHKLFYEDLTGDGVSELIIVTAKGLHIYQHNLKKEIQSELNSRLKILLKRSSHWNDSNTDTDNVNE